MTAAQIAESDQRLIDAAIRAGFVYVGPKKPKPGQTLRFLGNDAPLHISIIGTGLQSRVVVGRRPRFRPPRPNRGWENDWLRDRVWYPRLGWVTHETIHRQHRGGRTRHPFWQPVQAVPVKPSKARR